MIGSVDIALGDTFTQWGKGFWALTIPGADCSYNAPGFVMNRNDFIMVVEHLVWKCIRFWIAKPKRRPEDFNLCNAFLGSNQHHPKNNTIITYAS